jgi:hypothetical protein
MAGQSNMMGYGLVHATRSHGGTYTLDALVKSAASPSPSPSPSPIALALALALPQALTQRPHPNPHPNTNPVQVRSGTSQYQHLRDSQTGKWAKRRG